MKGIGLPARAQKEKGKKMVKLLTRLTSHVYRKKTEGNFLLFFVSGFMHVHAHAYIFFFFQEWAIMLWASRGGVPLDKPYRLMWR